MTQNLFIIGPVASGKNTLLNNLKKKYNMSVLDTGQLYRYLALCLLNETTINPDCEKLCKNDAEEENRISKAIFRWSRTIEKALDELEVVDGKLCLHGKILLEESLYSKEVNEIVSVVAKSNMVRNRILQFINVDIAKRKKNYALTGHNITELDTTKFTTVFLDISNEKAAQRLYGRNSMAYESVLSAYNEVLDRNNRDGMEQTKILMKDVYNMIYVDTTELSEERVTSIVIDEIEKIESKKQKFEELQATSSIERQNFKWMFNPFLEVIKAYLERNIDRYLVNKEYISRTDLEYQVLIKMCSYNIEKVFKGDSSLLREMDNGIKSREDNLNEFVDCLIEKKVNLNYELVNNEIKNQIERLDVLYNDDFIKKVMSKLNSSENKKNMSLKNITYKKVDKEVSKFIAKNCHYLHTPREDELFAYGAFGEESVLPIAWVSFSKQDREYKKQLLHYLEVEPQNTLEMTRAWCSNSAPSNIMSSLFQHSINEAKNEWKKLKQEGKVNKNLQAITTTINPNLGFKASSFLGCNFTPFALRPVKFTYGKQGGAVEYMTRREIEKNKLEYIENKFNVLPLNEIILCLDDKKQQEIAKGKIYAMDKKIYNRVLEEVMDEKILIATKNKDKFAVITKILDKISKESYEYYSLYDIENLTKNDKEEGDIESRAYNKAKQVYLSIKENDFEYIIGIDDGIKMKGMLRENVKDYIEEIVNDKYLINGEQVEIIRAYCFINKMGKCKILKTEIPFKYKKYDGKMKIEENSYPLSNVLCPIDSDKVVAEIDENENNEYYLKYSENVIKEAFI